MFADRPGKIETIDGLEAFKASAEFRCWVPRLEPGDEVGAPSDHRALVGVGIVAAVESEDLWSPTRRQRQEIQISLA
ncbi:MAG: hypothetical protein CL933_02640 [Deltaproteobacteria bacterium]|nr:hypothetical protein [Deltaproteobacteria bacterium]